MVLWSYIMYIDIIAPFNISSILVIICGIICLVARYTDICICTYVCIYTGKRSCIN